MGRYDDYGFPRYVPVAERRQQAAKKVAALKKRGQIVKPVHIEGRVIASTFWGKAWCDHLESYSDYENRLPRGRTYVRNGSVIDLQLKPGEISALVSGSEQYKITIRISALPATKWQALIKQCAGKLGSLVELLQGKFSKSVMEILTQPKHGLFPHPKEIKLHCSCPDSAYLCKHIAAVLYGVGARLDSEPECLFLLRQTDHTQLIAQAETTTLVNTHTTQEAVLADTNLSALFDIAIEDRLDMPTQPANIKTVPRKQIATIKPIASKQKIANALHKKAKTTKPDKKILAARTAKKASPGGLPQKNRAKNKKKLTHLFKHYQKPAI